ncbi:MAG: indole-3-glycerol phosphate synthase TrpC [Deltaproteobacteria bacterium]|nr:indole-3-glycerol phosphate synthase TrpC [Deltaproteobacteria bacterium]
MILDEIVSSKKEEIGKKRAIRADALLIQGFETVIRMTPLPRDFKRALVDKDIRIIAEVKKASPSKAVICEDFDPVRIALEYEQNGAAAISVLTEERFFKGSLEYLKSIREAVGLPLLRKDFLLELFEIYESRANGADAVLLIAAILDDARLKELLGLADKLGMSALIEAHTEDEVKRALDAGAEIIGINSRNLKTFEVCLDTAARLSALIPDDKIVVAESGINTVSDIKRLKQAGVDAFLIGEALMRDVCPGAKLKEFLAVG